jgi:hypothetical protein
MGINNHKEGQSEVGEAHSSDEVIIMIMERRGPCHLDKLFQTIARGPIVYDYYGTNVPTTRH